MNTDDLLRRSREIDQNTVELLNRKSPAELQADWNAISLRRIHQEQGKNLIDVITGRVKALEAGLQPGESLMVYCDAGRDRISVREIEFPNWHLAIIVGLDEDGNQTHRIEHVQDVKLTCKVAASAVKRNPIGFTLPSK